MENKKHFNQQTIAEGGVMLALSTALSLVTLFEMPYGGTVTLLSMLPIMLFSIKHGVQKGVPLAFLYGFFQIIATKSSPFAWGLNAKTLIVCLIADYVFAFGVLGLAGVFRKHGLKGQSFGIILAMLARFGCHYISGVTIWANLEKFNFWGHDIANKWLYSIAYNGAYMLPELALTLAGAIALLKLPVVSKWFVPAM